MLYARSARRWAAVLGAVSAQAIGAVTLSVSIESDRHEPATPLAEPDPGSGRLRRCVAAPRPEDVCRSEAVHAGQVRRLQEAAPRARLRQLLQRASPDVPVAELWLAYDDWGTPLASRPEEHAKRNVDGGPSQPSPGTHSIGAHPSTQVGG